jgi:hypothetical protein
MDATTLVNGQLASKLDVQDRGLAYGDGVFETMALVQGQVQLWPGHRQRLMTGLMTLGLVIDKASAGDLINVIIGDIKAAYALFGYPKGVIRSPSLGGVVGVVTLRQVYLAPHALCLCCLGLRGGVSYPQVACVCACVNTDGPVMWP